MGERNCKGGDNVVKSVFEATRLRQLQLKNRLFRSATWDGLVNRNGTLPDEVFGIYEELAKGGVGCIVTCLTDISPHDWALEGDMRLCGDELIPEYKRLTDLVKQHDCRIIPQLNLNQYVKVMPTGEHRVITDVDDLTAGDIRDVVDLFAKAAIRAEAAGFDGIQIHSAFGWILGRFLNPQTNHRTDDYGGSAENRARIHVEILEAIGKSVPDLHITTKIGFYSDLDDEEAVADYVTACRMLSEHGIDSIEISSNQHIIGAGEDSEAGFLPLALAVSKQVDTPLILVGGHRRIENMERILNETGVAYFSLSRPLIREPNLPARWRAGNRQQAKCISCDGCFRTHGKRCVFASKDAAETSGAT